MKNYTPTGQLGFTTPCGVEHEPVSEVTQNPADMTAVVQSLLQNDLSSFRVRRMSSTIASKNILFPLFYFLDFLNFSALDMMVNRIDELEQILKLRTAVGAEGWDPKSEAVTPGDDPK
ncbi:hypothetical protein MKW92_040954 [Papaver armeniacum]|nr:hypothetical protein MKW92_040954 [Papaver armeniacum]